VRERGRLLAPILPTRVGCYTSSGDGGGRAGSRCQAAAVTPAPAGSARGLGPSVGRAGRDSAAPRAARGNDVEQAAPHVDDGATLGALARVSAAAGNEGRAKLLLLGHDSARRLCVADVPAGEWVSNARLSVPTASAAASGATLVPRSRREIAEGQPVSRRLLCRDGDPTASGQPCRSRLAGGSVRERMSSRYIPRTHPHELQAARPYDGTPA
jgi:hypothetical protein